MAQDSLTYRQITDLISLVSDKLDEEIQLSGNNAWNHARITLSTLEFRPPLPGEQVERVADNKHNRDVVFRAMNRFWLDLQTAALKRRINEISETYTRILTVTTRYFGDRFGDPTVSAVSQAQGSTSSNKLNWQELSNFSSLRSEVFDPAAESLYLGLGDMTRAEYLANAQHRIQNRLNAYLVPLANALLMAHFRELNEIYANSYTLVWIRYIRETSQADRRDFCVKHESGLRGNPIHYHIKEVVELWPQYNEAGFPKAVGGVTVNWAGMIPGTDAIGSREASPMVQNAGGYNCKHSYQYDLASFVSKKDRARARRLGFII